uniref:Uncharacterized protein n=1 Tax=Percolomonas cosmopolitus TaxID=63605 RepID=A0A7S1PIK4_9EUKA
MAKQSSSKSKSSGKKHTKKPRKTLKKIYQINKHNANAKKKKQVNPATTDDPFHQEFLPKLQKKKQEKVKAKALAQKPSKKMTRVLEMMQSIKKVEQETGGEAKVDEFGNVVAMRDDNGANETNRHNGIGGMTLHGSSANRADAAKKSSGTLADLEGRDFETLTRKQKQKVKRKMQKEKKKVQKLERSLKKMYRKDKHLELDQDFAERLGEDRVEFGEQAVAPPTKDVFEKKKLKVAKSKAAFMTEAELKRYNLRQMAILRNQELQVQKAQQLYSEKRKRELQAEYSEFTDW